MEKFLKRSRLTGKEYDAFDSVSLLNILQIMAYINNGAIPLDIYVSKNKDNKACLVFIFSRTDTKELYDKWCKHELAITYDNGDTNEIC